MPTTTTPSTKATSPHVRVDRKKLRRLRQLSGMNQLELGRAAGLSNSYIGYLERGVRQAVSPAAFVRICDALDVLDRTELIAEDEEGEESQ